MSSVCTRAHCTHTFIFDYQLGHALLCFRLRNQSSVCTGCKLYLPEQSGRAPKTHRASKTHGLSGSAMWEVTQATLVNKMLYASPLWWGFTDASDKQRLQSIICRAAKSGFLPSSQAPFAELCGQADQALFLNIIKNPNHVLHDLLPPVKSTGHDLRSRARIGVSSLTIATAFHEKTFSIGCYPKIIYILNYDKIMDSSIY